MAIYRKGQASMDAQGYITGYGTKWRENLTLIRAGATIMFLTNPVKLGVITEVVSDTSIRAITTGGAVVARTDYVILLHDSLTVDGLAQDVAETLRYYQGKESEFSHFIEFLQGFDFAKLEDLTNQTKDAAAKAKTSETNAKASEGKAKTSETNAKNSKNAAAASQKAAKASENAAAASKNAAATSAANAEGSEVAAAASEAAAEASKNAAKNSENAAKASQTAAKTSENNAASSKTAAANSASAAKTSETNAKNSENKAKEYADKASAIASPLAQYNWPVGTAANERFVKIAKLTDPGSSDCHVTLMITNGGNYGARQGSIDFLDASARGLGNTTITASNVRQFMQIRRIGDPSLAEDNQMRYGVVKGDGFFEIWAYQRAFINNVKVAILAKAGRVDLYVPTGAVTQAEAPDGWVKSVAIRVYDEVNKPSRSDLGLANVMEIGAFGLGGSGISHSDITSNADLMQRMKEKGGHFWRSSQKSGTTSNVMSHGSGIFSRCGDTNSAINIDYASGKVVILAANDASLAAGNVKVNTLYGTANKPSKSDVGLGNVTNDAQVRKVGDTMTGDLDISKGTPSIRLKSASGNAHLWFMNADGKERGVIWSPENTASLGEIRIRAKTTDGTTGGDVVIRHDGRLEAKDVKAAYRFSGQSLVLANTDTNAGVNSIAVSGKQHTPIMLTRDADSNLSIGFKLNNMNTKLLGVDNEGDISFGENADQKQNSKIVTRKMMDAGFSVAGFMNFTNGFAGAWEAKNIADQKLDLNSLMIKKSDPGTVYVYQCPSAGGGSNITNKPGGVAGNFILYVESIRKVSDTDFTNRQRLFGTESNREFVRYCNNGTWSAWRESIVSGMNQDVSVKTLSASGRLSGGELAVGGAGSLNGNLGVGGGAASKVPGSDKGIVIGRGAMVREGGEGRLILSASGGTDRQVQLRPAGAAASDNGIEISCTSASGGDTKIAFGQGAAIRSNSSGSPIISAKAGQMIYIRPNGDGAANGQVTIAGNGNMVVDGEVVSKGLTAKSGQITTNDGGIELFHASPYVDFHFNKSAKDYTARIINDAEDQLTFDCRSVRALRDFTARGSIRGCYNDAFVAWPIEDPTGGNGTILKAPSFISRFNAIGNAARCAMWLEEHRGYEHRAVIEVSKWGDSGTTQYWQFKANGKISSTAHGDVVFAGLSDINYKDNVVDYDGLQSLENIKAMNLVKFTYKDDEQKRARRGVIAQQVREIDPCYVKESDASYQDENGNVVENKRLVLDSNPLLMDALCAIKALSAQVDELKEEIRKLKGE
ncbi:pyocin knob domain-containing S74 family peptidase [Phascolarctobacterium sp.]|uniref:pyocin knob domain-containing S74 family peptidase n=1 Tax=Phascolarctobacterium sp. TaxID=2049039 RepID=UPI0025E737CF|nr:pyocin knob domain-containing S74 family peptidase [Phascolarctobacterium sp.]